MPTASDAGLPSTMRQILLKRRPQGLVDHDDFELVEAPVPELADGEALMRTVYLSMDATVRSWLDDSEGYFPPVAIGEVVRASNVGPIVASKCDAYEVGDLVMSLGGWSEYSICRDDFFTSKLHPGVTLRSALSLVGATGTTAYFGLLEIGRPKEGETLVVSGAAGATGSLVGQIGKIKGCRVIGIAGSDDKCAWLVDELGFDACINYKTDDVAARLKELCPRVDIYFDNVGGPILDAVLARLNDFGRVVLCGAIAGYTDEHRPPGPSNYLNLITRRGTMRGFLAFDYWDRREECYRQLEQWRAEGKLRSREHVVEGLEHAPDALNLLFTGGNTGKLVVQVSDE